MAQRRFDLHHCRGTRKGGVITSVKIGEFVVPVTVGRRIVALCRSRPSRPLCVGRRSAGPWRPVGRGAAMRWRAASSSSASRRPACRTSAPPRSARTCPASRCTPRRSSRSCPAVSSSRPDWADGLEILAIALLGTLLVLLTIFVSPAIALVCGLALTGAGAGRLLVRLLLYGLLFDPLAPIVAGSITHFAATSFRFLVTDRERRADPACLRPVSVALAAPSHREYAATRCGSAATIAS